VGPHNKGFLDPSKAKIAWTLVFLVVLVAGEIAFHALFDRAFYRSGGTPPSLLKLPLEALEHALGQYTVYSSECSVFCLPQWWAVLVVLFVWIAICYALACMLAARRRA
jgi:hypothetical protein